MVITTPTRITIDVTPLQPGEEQDRAPRSVARIVVRHQAGNEPGRPAAYEPAPCHCLDDEDCAADHEHE